MLQIQKSCKEKLHDYEIADSTKIDWPNIRKKISREKIDRIVVVGGDGALRFIMEKLCHQDVKTEVAFIPKGSANIAARSLRIPISFTKAFKRSTTGSARKIDIGMINDRRLFFVACVCGQLAKLTTQTTRADKKELGAIAYVKNVKKISGPYKEESIEILINEDTKKMLSTHSLIICNHLNIHTLKPKRGILHNDGKLDLFVIKNKKFSELFYAIHKFYQTTEKINQTFTQIPFKKIIIKNNPLFKDIHVDGDIIHIDGDITIKTLSHKINFVY